MYLEISGRATGKTTRLIEDVSKRVVEGGYCVIFTSNNFLKNMLCGITKNINIYTSYDRYIEQHRGISIPDDTYFYYDDFDMFNDPIIISKMGYYTTTAKRIRTKSDFEAWESGELVDPMITLLYAVKNYDGEFVSYINEEWR
jgi:hypothetical protein